MSRWSLPWRWQPPVHSPIPLGAIWAALLACLHERWSTKVVGAGAGGGEAREWLRDFLARRYSADAVVLAGSGTDALQRAIVGACQRIGRGAVAAIPAYGCYDIATAAIGAEVRFFLYDIDPVTLGPDLDSLGSAIAAGASVIVVAPLYGVPVEWGEIVALVSRVGGVIVEDAAQAHGASWQGFPLGSLGDYSVLSFGRGKGWSGGGRGGTLLSRGPAADAIDSEGYDISLVQGGRRSFWLLSSGC